MDPECEGTTEGVPELEDSILSGSSDGEDEEGIHFMVLDDVGDVVRGRCRTGGEHKAAILLLYQTLALHGIVHGQMEDHHIRVKSIDGRVCVRLLDFTEAKHLGTGTSIHLKWQTIEIERKLGLISK